MYRYETHLHTSPASKCAKASVRESLICYQNLGYAGVFITNHFIDGNIGCDRTLPYKEMLDFYFGDYHEALAVGKELNFPVFLGVEMSYGGTDFLIYGLDEDWYYAHPEIKEMKRSEELTLLREAGALIIQAHPFREAAYIDHIRLFPRHVDGVEVINANREEDENNFAKFYAEHYGLKEVAGSDNHSAANQTFLAGVEFDRPLTSELDYRDRVLTGEATVFTLHTKPVETL